MTPRQELIKYLLEFGFEEEEITKILMNKQVKNSKEETMLEHAKEINLYLLSNGYIKQDIISMVISNPKFYTYTKNRIEQRTKELLNLGFAKEDIPKMVKRYSKIYSYKIERIIERIAVLKSFDFTEKKAIKTLSTHPSLIGYDKNTLLQREQELINLGHDEKYAKKIIRSIPLILQDPKEKLEARIKEFESLGYTRQQFIKMAGNLTQLYTYSIENNIKPQFTKLINIGYKNKENVIKMTKVYPHLFSYSIEKIEKRIKEIENLGFSREEVIQMTLSLTALFGYDIEKIKRRVDYLKDINLDFIITKNTKQLMQSIELTYARYEYLKQKHNLEINETNYKILFWKETQFTNKYKITNKELLKEYDYTKYLEAKNARTI